MNTDSLRDIRDSNWTINEAISRITNKAKRAALAHTNTSTKAHVDDIVGDVLARMAAANGMSAVKWQQTAENPLFIERDVADRALAYRRAATKQRELAENVPVGLFADDGGRSRFSHTERQAKARTFLAWAMRYPRIMAMLNAMLHEDAAPPDSIMDRRDAREREHGHGIASEWIGRWDAKRHAKHVEDARSKDPDAHDAMLRMCARFGIRIPEPQLASGVQACDACEVKWEGIERMPCPRCAGDTKPFGAVPPPMKPRYESCEVSVADEPTPNDDRDTDRAPFAHDGGLRCKAPKGWDRDHPVHVMQASDIPALREEMEARERALLREMIRRATVYRRIGDERRA